jgi:hypothetical protein
MAKNTNTKAVSGSDTANAAAEGVNAAENTETATPATAEGATPHPPEGGESTESAAPSAPRFPGVTSFVYAGPTLPGGQLKKHTVLSGTYEEIAGYYKDAIKEYPNVARFIVPATRFAETRDKTQTSGNILYKWYQEIAAAIKAKGVEN